MYVVRHRGIQLFHLQDFRHTHSQSEQLLLDTDVGGGKYFLSGSRKSPLPTRCRGYPQSQPCVLRKPAGQSGRLKRTIFPSTEVTVCTACKAENGSCFKHPVIKGENSSDTSCYMCRGLWLALQQN